MMENEIKLNEIPESDLDSVSGGVNWHIQYEVRQIVKVSCSGGSSERKAVITHVLGNDTYQVKFLDGQEPKTARINYRREIID